MLEASTLLFLRDLKKNNNRSWFEENRKRYENAKVNFASFVERLIKEIGAFDEPIGLLEVKDCTFRINRDVRFSKDKSPYKANMAAYFSKGGKKAMVAGYYFHAEPGKNFSAGGFYTPMPAELAKIRQEIDYNFEEWSKIIANKNFRQQFPEGIKPSGSLVRPPKGYEEDNPAIDYLKMKDFIVTHPFPDAAIQDARATRQIALAFKAMKPMIDFLNRAVE